MQPLLVRHLWGNPRTLSEAAIDAAAKGYQAIEAPVITEKDLANIRDNFVETEHSKQLGLVVQIHTAAFKPGVSPTEHLADFRQRLAWAVSLNPLLVNVHAGGDHFSDAENLDFFKEFVKIADVECPVPVTVETHRARPFYNPWTTARVLEAVPEVQLCTDFSHWTVVCEKMLPHCDDIIDLCAKHTGHLHARVGHSQGPQVNDPRAPENANAVEIFEGWWDRIWAAQKAAGKESLTMCPEFGPAPYLDHQPYTGMPVANLDHIVDWMADRLRTRYTE